MEITMSDYELWQVSEQDRQGFQNLLAELEEMLDLLGGARDCLGTHSLDQTRGCLNLVHGECVKQVRSLRTKLGLKRAQALNVEPRPELLN